jgi:hypothetical protein
MSYLLLSEQSSQSNFKRCLTGSRRVFVLPEIVDFDADEIVHWLYAMAATYN